MPRRSFSTFLRSLWLLTATGMLLGFHQLSAQQDTSLNFQDALSTDVDTTIFQEILSRINSAPKTDVISLDTRNPIAMDTSYAAALITEASRLLDSMELEPAFRKVDSARQIFISALGYMVPEVAACIHQMGDIKASEGQAEESMALFFESTRIRLEVFPDGHEDLAWSFYNLGDRYLGSQQYAEAAEGYRQAAMVYAKVLGETHPFVATTLINVGNMYYFQGKMEMTISYYLRALDIKLNSGNEPDAGLITLYNNIGVFYSITGAYDRSIEFLKKGLDIGIKLNGDMDPGVARSFHNIGTLYSYTGDLDQALEFVKKGLQIRTRTLDAGHPDLADSYNILGTLLADKADYNHALEYYFKALAIREKALGGAHTSVGTMYNNIGDCFSRKGEYDKALEYLLKGLNIKLPVLGDLHPDIANMYSNIGNIYWYKGDYLSAMPYYERAMDINFRTYGEGHPSVMTNHIQAGNGYSHMGKYDEAMDRYQKALDVSLKIYGPAHSATADIYNNMGDCFSRKGDFVQALEYAQRSMGVLEEDRDPNPERIMKGYNNLGELYASVKNYPDALLQFDKALAASNTTASELSSTPSIDQWIRAEQGAAFALKQMFEQDRDLDILDQADQHIENALAAISHEIRTISPEKYAFRQASHHALYELALDIYALHTEPAKQDHASEYFTIAERSKAGLLRSGISASDALSFSGIPDSLLEKEYDLRIDINWREKQRQGLLDKGATTDDPDFLHVSSLLFDLKREQEQLIQTFEENYPDYYALKYDLATVSLDRVQRSLLSTDQSLVEYFKGDSTLFTMVVTRDSFAVVSSRISLELDSLVRQLNTGLYGYYGNPAQQSDALYRQTVNDYIDASTRLYQLLIEPVKGLLRDELIIIPDGILSMVPFETLLSAKPENISRFDAYPYLIKDHSISYAYSATLLDQMKNRQHKAPPQKTLIAFAPFYEGSYALLDSTIQVHFDSTGGRDTVIFEDLVMRNELSPLPSSGEEVKTATSLWDGQYYINRDATEERFTAEAGDYRIVHLSTHGVADARQGDYSYLAFAEVDDYEENELLFVRDIYNISLNAELVVLSACETARGELQKGEGVISLARAFAYAGAKSMVTSLWKVDDSSTRDLMKTMYLDLRRGAAKDRALRNAKLQFLKKARRNQKHPFFWAGFIGVGDMSPIR